MIAIAERILALVGGSDLKPIILGEATNEIPHQYASAQKARIMLGLGRAFPDQGLGALARVLDGGGE